MARVDERHQQIVLKANELCDNLAPFSGYRVLVHDALMQMAKFVEDLFTQSQWVSVTERIPENKYHYLHEDDKVLCKSAKGERITCYWSEAGQCWWGDGSSIRYPKDKFTHWMRSPK